MPLLADVQADVHGRGPGGRSSNDSSGKFVLMRNVVHAGGRGQPHGEVMAILQRSPQDIVACMSEPDERSLREGTSRTVMHCPPIAFDCLA